MSTEFKKFTIEEKQAFAARYNVGAKLKELAAEAGVSIPTMAKYVRTGGGTVRRPGNPNNPKKGSKPGWPTPVAPEQPVVEEAPARKIMSF